MSNPASELYDLLSDWQYVAPNQSILVDRQGDHADWWPEHARAVRLFDKVRAEVGRRVRLGKSLRIASSGALERLGEGIFATGKPMNSTFSTQVEIFNDSDLVALELLGESWPTPPPLHPTIAAGLLAFAKDARDLLLDESSTLDEDSSRYLLKLIDALAAAIHSAQRNEGSADVRRLCSELVGALGALLLEGEGEQQDKARKLVERSLTWVKAIIVDKGTGAFFTSIGAAGGAAATHYLGLPPGP